MLTNGFVWQKIAACTKGRADTAFGSARWYAR
jgi:hypothetical protein